MTPQERIESEEWQEWKRKYDNEKKQERRLAWAAALFVAWTLGTLLYGLYTGEIKLGKSKYGHDYEPNETHCTRAGWGGDC